MPFEATYLTHVQFVHRKSSERITLQGTHRVIRLIRPLHAIYDERVMTFFWVENKMRLKQGLIHLAS
jgi:hypothetical protein